MSKPTVFISHIGEEAALAKIVKDAVERDFLGMIDTFVSSDSGTISLGQKWLDSISQGLSNSAVTILLCSPYSVSRPWINFEAGAGWVKGIPVIPLCHSGMAPVKLPIPLNMLQAFLGSDAKKLKDLYTVIAKSLDSATPNPDFNALSSAIAAFETGYRLEYEVITHLTAIKSHSIDLASFMKKHNTVAPLAIRHFPQLTYGKIEPSLEGLKKEGLIDFNFIGGALVGGIGPAGNLTIIMDPKFLPFLSKHF